MYILISIFAAYAIGIISFEHGCFGYFFTAVLVLLIFNSIKSRHFIYNSVIIAFLILSFINCNYNSKYIITQYINEDMEFTAKIKTKNKSNEDSAYESYNATVVSINGTALNSGENTIIYANKNDGIKENSIISFKGRAAESNFSKNKIMFNYSSYLRAKKIGAVIFTRSPVVLLEQEYSILNKMSAAFRNYTEDTFYVYLNKENADIILSVILGDVDYLDDNLYNNIKMMGLAHIFAVSGTHIVLMYGAMFTAFKLLGLSRRISWTAAWAMIWFYGFLIGFPLSVMRALVMFTLLFGAEVLYRKYSSLNSIGLATLVLTLYNPFWLFDAGFLLSFSAALSLIVYNRYVAEHALSKNVVINNLYLYLFLQLFTLPVIAYYFNYLPVMGIIYNLFLLPIFTVILIYGFILLILNGFFHALLIVPFKIFDYLLYSLRYGIGFTDRFAFNGIIVPSMTAEMIIFFYAVLAFVLYLYRRRDSRIAIYGATALISFCLINFIIMPAGDNSLYFNVVDAGQGLFTLVSFKNTNMIIDCGSTSTKNFGEYTVVPYLTKLGITNIDGVFISHWDYDHYSGLTELLNSHIKVKRVFSSSPNEEIPKEIYVLNKGNNLKFDKLKIDILWPDERYSADSANNKSLVILLRFNDKSILLTGDIEGEVENELANYIVHSDILIVPHHGSKTSSTEGFVEKVSPDIAVMSYGKNNYGIPSAEVISRYERENSIVLSTFNEGEINFILKGDKIYYNTYTKEKSDNYYELYFEGILFNLMNFCLLLYWIVNDKGEDYEL